MEKAEAAPTAESGGPVLISLMISDFLASLVKLKRHIRTAIVSTQKLEAMVEQKWKGIILITGNLGHIQIPMIIQSIGIIPLVSLIYSLQSIIQMARLNLRALKEGSI